MKNTWTLLSIDLPWGKKSFTSATYIKLVNGEIVEFRCFTARIRISSVTRFAKDIQARLKLDPHSIDLILIDMPLHGTKYSRHQNANFRGGELATMNAFNFRDEYRDWYYPSYLPGRKIAPLGRIRASAIQTVLGTKDSRVCEIFPQTVVPAVVRLAPERLQTLARISSHKKNMNPCIELLDVLHKIFVPHMSDECHERYEFEPRFQGLPDLCDSLLGMLPILDLLTEGKFTKRPAAWFRMEQDHRTPMPREARSEAELTRLRSNWVHRATLTDLDHEILPGILTYDPAA